jgi:hypothetical protein
MLSGLAGLIIVIGSLVNLFAIRDEYSRSRSVRQPGVLTRLKARHRAHPRIVEVHLISLALALVLLVLTAIALAT